MFYHGALSEIDGFAAHVSISKEMAAVFHKVYIQQAELTY